MCSAEVLIVIYNSYCIMEEFPPCLSSCWLPTVRTRTSIWSQKFVRVAAAPAPSLVNCGSRFICFIKYTACSALTVIINTGSPPFWLEFQAFDSLRRQCNRWKGSRLNSQLLPFKTLNVFFVVTLEFPQQAKDTHVILVPLRRGCTGPGHLCIV